MTIVENKVTGYLTANFSETETAWSSGSTYSYKSEARDGHYIYAYTGNANTNTTASPATFSQTDPLTPWVQMRPTNYWAMLDGRTDSQTAVLNQIVIEISDINYDYVSILDIDGINVAYELKDSVGTVVYSLTNNLQDESAIIDFYTYCFSPFLFKKNDLVSLPIYGGTSKLKITLNASTGNYAKIGRLVFGNSFFIADTAMGGSLGLESYSPRSVDPFGNATLTHIGAVNLQSFQVRLHTSLIPTIQRKIIALDAIPCLFIMDETVTSNVENLLTYGYWQDFNINHKGCNYSYASTTLKGLL